MEIMDNNESIKPYEFKLFEFELVKPKSSNVMPDPRSGHRIVCTPKELYCFGGYNPNVSLASTWGGRRELWKFNFSSKIWTLVKYSNLPREIMSPAVIRRRQKLLIFGGTAIPFGLTCSNELHSIKLDGDYTCAKIKTSGKKPELYYGAAILMHKNIFYTIGGRNIGSFSLDIYKLDLSYNARIWKPLYVKKKEYQSASNEENSAPEQDKPYEPNGRYRHEVGFDGTNIYIIGGGTNLKTFDLKDIPVFNLHTKCWKILSSKGDLTCDPQYPHARKCHGIAQEKTEKDVHLYVIGGNNQQGILNDFWRLELSTLQWKCIRKNALPIPIYQHSVALTKDGKLYVFGGIEKGSEIERSNQIYAAWIHVPKLFEMAWEAFFALFSTLCNTQYFE